ncbi:hypothetical protein B0H10DRAFT_565668 [Mycena sp. CBHHK59/15]|nr:hypothetical protein B0H10DRAFT_565668 [Mycena sp. CBHHK59/15]
MDFQRRAASPEEPPLTPPSLADRTISETPPIPSVSIATESTRPKPRRIIKETGNAIPSPAVVPAMEDVSVPDPSSVLQIQEVAGSAPVTVLTSAPVAGRSMGPASSAVAQADEEHEVPHRARRVPRKRAFTQAILSDDEKDCDEPGCEEFGELGIIRCDGPACDAKVH